MSAAERIYRNYIESLSRDERARLLELWRAARRTSRHSKVSGPSIWEEVETDEYVDELRGGPV